jgi:hypothetical protein
MTPPRGRFARLLSQTPPLAALACGILALALLAGCGKSLPAQSRRPVAHAGAAGATKALLTTAQALAFARAVNLTAGDVPAFAATPPQHPESEGEKRLELRLHRCAGPVGGGAPLAQVPSSRYRLRRGILDLGVNSEVDVAQTAALAGRELGAIRSERVRRCFSRYLDLLLREDRFRGARPQPVSIASGTPPAPGASGSFGWRITATYAVRGIPLSLYVDILGFVVGPARVTLVSSGALRPFPAQIQQRLFRVLLARATADAL